MVTHQIRISELGTGASAQLKKLALSEGSGYSYRHIAAYEDYEAGADPFDFLHNGELDEQLRRSPSLFLVLDGFQELSPIRRSMLVGRMLTWSTQNRDLPVDVFWLIEGSLPNDEEVLEAFRDVLPLVRFYETQES